MPKKLAQRLQSIKSMKNFHETLKALNLDYNLQLSELNAALANKDIRGGEYALVRKELEAWYEQQWFCLPVEESEKGYKNS